MATTRTTQKRSRSLPRLHVKQKRGSDVNNLFSRFSKLGAALVFAITAGVAGSANAAKLIVINADDPGVGFNDPTPAAPVGINKGKTVGEQRLIAANFVASLWARALGGNDQIEVLATFAPQECDARSGVLASAGPINAFRDFDNAPFRGTWYPGALANRLAKVDLDAAAGDPLPEIIVFSNGNLGSPGCLERFSWYYGLDDNAPANSIDYVRTILHEFGHGLGFLSFVDESDGTYFDGFPSVWEHFLLDSRTYKRWVNMTNAERKASAVNNQNLAWAGIQSYIGAQSTLATANVLDVNLSDSKGFYSIPSGNADFGKRTGRSIGGFLAYLDDSRAPGAACAAFTPAQVSQVKGKVALIDRGGCAFTVKAANAQRAGATAIIFVNNTPSFGGRPTFGVDDPSAGITIASALVSQQDGAILRRTLSPWAFVFLFDDRRPAGTTISRFPLMYAPTVVSPGSSVSHWDTSASPNLLMEPFAEDDESTTLKPPRDLTLPLLKDIGW
jgi:PA domain